MIRRSLAAAFLVIAAAALLVLAWPQPFGLEASPLIAQAVSLRPLAIVTALVLAALVGLALLSVRARRLAASVIALLLVFSAINLAVLATRGFGNPAFAQKAAGDITVLSWNTLGEQPGTDAIARVALESDADVVALPETTSAGGVAIAELMRDGGKPMWVHTNQFDAVSKARSTTLLISAELGDYEIDRSVGDTSVLPTVVAKPVDGDGPTIVAVHAVAPLPRFLDRWQADLEWLAGICRGSNVIMAGDFNATLDHFARYSTSPERHFGDCTDAAMASDNAAVGTWPNELPALLGSPIDHVLATQEWQTTGMRIVEAPGSDHRPVVAQLSPAR